MTTPRAELVLGALTLIAVGLLYVAPLLVAATRDVTGLPRLVHLNVLLGWTVVVWIYCLVAALRRPPREAPAPRPPAPPLGQPRKPQHDRVPDWVRDLPPAERTWRALPRDTAPLHLEPPEDR